MKFFFQALLFCYLILITISIDKVEIDRTHLGTSTLIKGITVYSAVVMSILNDNLIDHTSSKGVIDHSVSTPLNGNETNHISLGMELAIRRAQHFRKMSSEFPFPVVEWPAVYTRPCPYSRHVHKTERGLGLAHYQIWLDFIYFDPDVLKVYNDKGYNKFKHNQSYTSTWYSSNSGKYMVNANGTLYKNDIIVSEDDIIIIFEDDADIAIIDFNTTIVEELSTMDTDILYLGWCEGRNAKPIPLCSHAYALTRRGARKVIEHYEPCGLAIDEQFVIMARNKWLTYRPAHSWSYKDRFNSNYPVAHDKTFGIFHQKKLGTLNGH